MKARLLVGPGTLVTLVLFLSQCSGSEPAQDTGDGTVTGTVTTDTGSTTSTGGASSTSTGSTSTVTSTSAANVGVGGSSTTTATATTTAASTTATATTTSTGGATASTSDSTASSMGGAMGTTGDSTVSTGAGGGTSMGAGGTGSMGGEFVLTSSELAEGAAFMDKSTCALNGFDNDESPPFAWSGAPAGTQSFALVLLDVTLTDMGDMNGYHWAMWDIPASVSELPANLPTGATITDPVSAKQYNPLSASYLGPCPNIGGGSATHTYEFTLYAMPEAETTALAGLNNVQQLDMAIKAAAIGSATLSGTSDAAP